VEEMEAEEKDGPRCRGVFFNIVRLHFKVLNNSCLSL
jgi:hypothetical protein